MKIEIKNRRQLNNFNQFVKDFSPIIDEVYITNNGKPNKKVNKEYKKWLKELKHNQIIK